MKPINLLAFLLGLSLVFPMLSHAGTWTETSSASGWNCFINSCNNYICENGSTVYDWSGPNVGSHNSYSWAQYQSWVVDAGCVPPPAEPAYCSDGSLSAGEVGIDCGGECSNSCDSSICESATAILADNLCVERTPPDAFGNCPTGTTLHFTEAANVCQTPPIPPIQYYSGDVTNDPYDDLTFDPPPPINPFEPGQLSIVETTNPPTTVDNGDGTSTVTTITTTTTTNQDGDTYTTTSTTVYNVDNSTGDTIAGSEVTTTESDAPTIGLISPPAGLDFGNKLSNLLSSSRGEFEGYVSDVQNSDLVESFTNVFSLPTDPGSSPLTLSMGAYGVHLVDSEMMDTTLSLVGQVLVVCAFITGAFIVFRKQ